MRSLLRRPFRARVRPRYFRCESDRKDSSVLVFNVTAVRPDPAPALSCRMFVTSLPGLPLGRRAGRVGAPAPGSAPPMGRGGTRVFLTPPAHAKKADPWEHAFPGLA
jgi:hypothetical protein